MSSEFRPPSPPKHDPNDDECISFGDDICDSEEGNGSRKDKDVIATNEGLGCREVRRNGNFCCGGDSGGSGDAGNSNDKVNEILLEEITLINERIRRIEGAMREISVRDEQRIHYLGGDNTTMWYITEEELSYSGRKPVVHKVCVNNNVLLKFELRFNLRTSQFTIECNDITPISPRIFVHAVKVYFGDTRSYPITEGQVQHGKKTEFAFTDWKNVFTHKISGQPLTLVICIKGI